MAKNKADDLSNMMYCISVLEEKTHRLYKGLAEKVDPPLVKSLLLHIAYDSQKHSTIFKGISESIAKPKRQDKNCEKIGPTWKTIESLTSQVSLMKRTVPTLSEEELPSLIKKLTKLESTLGEEYYVLVQAKTLRYMTEEVSDSYKVDMRDMKDILESIIRDEEFHGELLAKIKKMLVKEEKQESDTSAKVKYNSPDAWSRAMPDAVYEGAV
jgi:ribonucleotide reductase beta subunit family protein with ferritin-like domain